MTPIGVTDMTLEWSLSYEMVLFVIECHAIRATMLRFFHRGIHLIEILWNSRRRITHVTFCMIAVSVESTVSFRNNSCDRAIK